MEFVLGSNMLRLVCNAQGSIASCTVLGRELISERPSPFLRAAVGGKLYQPCAAMPRGGEWVFRFEGIGEVVLAVQTLGRYLRFEVMACPDEVDSLLWGPMELRLNEQAGEILGVLHDAETIVGLMGLHTKVLGGIPQEHFDLLDAALQYAGDPTNITVEHIEVHARAAARTSGGAALQLHVRNRHKERTLSIDGIETMAPALPDEDAGIVGAAIALWGGARADALDIVEAIEFEQCLPHPMIGGAWGKTSRETMRAYLICDFDETDVPLALEKAKAAGFSHIYHTDPFETWGHFVLSQHRFPDRERSLRRIVDMAAEVGLGVGIHTLTSFTTTNDGYVTPIPSKHLLKQGEGRLAQAITALDEAISIRGCVALNAPCTLNCVQIQDELITYASVEQAEQTFHLYGCTRGTFGTIASAHAAETLAWKLWDYPYKTLFPDIFLQDAYCDRLIDLFNQTGLSQISFDGLEGCRNTGHGEYAVTRFVARCYAGWQTEVINDASRLNHYNWHIHSRMNWGEPWGEKMREGQFAYRVTNQDFFRRNLFPGMLGWFLIRLASRKFHATSLEDLEWALSEAAGFDAGYGMTIHMQTMRKHGQIDLFMDTMRRWDALRLSGKLSQAQKNALKDPKTEWHLASVEGQHHLFPMQLSRGFVCDLAEMQPGQSGGADWVWSNDLGEEKTFQLQLYVEGDGEIRQPTLHTQRGTLRFQATLCDTQCLLYDGESATLCDKNFRTLQSVPVVGSGALRPGAQPVSFSCDHDKYDTPEIRVRYKLLGTPWVIEA